MASDIDFSKHYIVYGHGARDIKSNNRDVTSNFTLNSNYRIVTLHAPGKEIYKPLVKIVLNKIAKKSVMINDLFLINCPIARKICKERFENELIKEYFIEKFKRYPEKTNEELNEINNSVIKLLDYEINDELYEPESTEPERFIDFDDLTNNSINIRTIEELNEYLEVNFEQIKKKLNFEIRLYRPGDLCPKLRLDFKIYHSLSLLKGGIFNINTFDNFNLEDYELEYIRTKKQTINSLVNFNNKYQYVFDNADISDSKLSFFDTIRETIPTGTLVILSCGSYDGIDNTKLTSDKIKLVRTNSDIRQNTTFRKYYIKYD